MSTISDDIGCLTTIDNYLIWTDNSVEIYDLTQSTWITTSVGGSPSIDSGCEISDEKYLYTIGGSLVAKLYVGDIANINNYNWITLSGSLSVSRYHAHSVIYNDKIYFMGGYTGSGSTDAVDVIDTNTDQIYTISPLADTLFYGSPVIISNRIYMFGGYYWPPSGTSRVLSSYQYYDLPNEQIETTSSPTSNPSMFIIL